MPEGKDALGLGAEERLHNPLDRYHIGRQLGEGGFGKVFFAVDTQTRQPRALKIITLTDEERRQLATREAQIPADLWHKNLLIIYDAFPATFQNQAVYVIVLEYLDISAGWQSVADALDNSKAGLSAPRVFSILSQLVDALNFLRTNGISHDDLKPDVQPFLSIW
jgi:serine/threonine-protein kinase